MKNIESFLSFFYERFPDFAPELGGMLFGAIAILVAILIMIFHHATDFSDGGLAVVLEVISYPLLILIPFLLLAIIAGAGAFLMLFFFSFDWILIPFLLFYIIGILVATGIEDF